MVGWDGGSEGYCGMGEELRAEKSISVGSQGSKRAGESTVGKIVVELVCSGQIRVVLEHRRQERQGKTVVEVGRGEPRRRRQRRTEV